ncbi:MAG: hypothetical protein H6815_07085 [Phycisphaeraceae bacterium]|nr:hypothetical protein [Phycisphaerales bacterium]MCB9860204.1 hypothetical protein [Phycisphaeraceae bacterium]
MNSSLLPLSDHPWLVLGIALCTIAGLCLIWRGFRGKRLNDHPICRTCEFDLVGLPLSTGGVEHCPECGADLQAKRAIESGERKHRPAFVVIGFCFLAVACMPAFVDISVIVDEDWIRAHKPAWMLEHEVRNTESNDEIAILKELTKRIQQSNFSHTRAHRLTDTALVRESDELLPLDIRAAWTELLLASNSMGLCDADTFVQHVVNTLEVEVEFPSGFVYRESRSGQCVVPYVELHIQIPHVESAVTPMIRIDIDRIQIEGTDAETINARVVGDGVKIITVRPYQDNRMQGYSNRLYVFRVDIEDIVLQAGSYTIDVDFSITSSDRPAIQGRSASIRSWFETIYKYAIPEFGGSEV